MLRLTLALALFLAWCAPVAPMVLAARSQHADSTHTIAKKDSVVYITRRGSAYHREDYRFLKKSKIPLPLSEAKKFYRPCKVCNPVE